MSAVLSRRTVAVFTAAALALPGMAQAATWPERPLTLIVPYAPGSPADVVARGLGEGLARRLGQPVIVENRPGANGMLGTQAVARAKPDGYTLELGNMDTHAVNPLLYKNIAYQPERDFAPIVLVSQPTTVLVARPGLPVANGAELIAAARRAPGKLSYGSWGLGSVAHLWALLLEQAAGIELYHVPYQGSPAALNALIGEQIDLMFMSPAQAISNQQAGKLKIIGSTAAMRLPQYPQLPTLAEQGFKGYEGTTWFGVFAPAQTPEPMLQRLNQELNTVLKAPETAERLALLSMTPVGGERQDLQRLMAASRQRWAALIAQHKLQID